MARPRSHPYIPLISLSLCTPDGCPCHPLGTICGHGHHGDGDNPPRLGNGAAFSHRAVTFGEHILPAQLNTSAASQGNKTSQIRGTPKLSGICMEESDSLGGSAHAGRGAPQAQILMQANPACHRGEDSALRTIFGLFLPALEPLIYDIVTAVTKGSAVGVTSSQTWREGCWWLSGDR